MKKLLIIGANSYIAKAFIQKYQNHFEICAIKRDGEFDDYFLLSQKDFQGIDTVINFTAIVHNKKADERMHKKINYELLKLISTLAKKAGVSHFVQMSTIAVYGDINSIYPTTSPDPNTPYGVYKHKADEYLSSIVDQAFCVSIVRPPMVYGKSAPGNMKMLFRLVKSGWYLPLGYFENSRAILCIDNLTSALFKIIAKKSCGIFLLKDDESASIGKIVENLQKNLFGKSRLIRVPKWLVKLFLMSHISVFDKLFDDLLIDDQQSKDCIGEYNLVSFEDCLNSL